MENNPKNKIIKQAWYLIKDDINIKKLYFLPGLLSIIFLTILLVYQSIYTYVVIFHQKQKALEIILNFFHSQYALTIIIAFFIFLLIYFLITPIFEWACIKYIFYKSEKKDISIWEALSLWIYKFSPLFKYWNLFSEFKFLSVFNGYLFTIRFFDWKYIKQITYAFLILWLISIILNIFIIYSKYIIVIENKKVFESVSKSFKLAIITFYTTLKLYLLMFILNIRVIINFLVFLLFPITIISLIWIITSKIFLSITIIILSIIFIIFVLFLWFLTWTLEVFKNAIWFFAYKNAIIKLNKLEDK